MKSSWIIFFNIIFFQIVVANTIQVGSSYPVKNIKKAIEAAINIIDIIDFMIID